MHQRIFNLLETSDLNWSVEKIQLFPEIDKKREVPKSFGIYNTKNGKWLGTVGYTYQPLQNARLAEIFIQALVKIGHEGETKGGHLVDGRKVFLQARLEDAQIHTDIVKRYITTLNSHDGSTATTFGTSNTVVVCQNTFYRAMRDATRKIRHTASAADRVELEAENLIRVINAENKLIDTYTQMAAAPLMPKTINGLLQGLFKVSGDTNLDKLNSRKKNQMISLSNVIKSETKSHGNTIWGLFNGITYYYNHVAPAKERIKFLLEDTGAKMQNKAYEILSAEVTSSYN